MGNLQRIGLAVGGEEDLGRSVIKRRTRRCSRFSILRREDQMDIVDERQQSTGDLDIYM
jgi:hypothetical protein